MKILWHISSHGWGHAARQRELIRVYRQKHPEIRITVASDVPLWFWRDSGISEIRRGSPSPAAIEINGKIDSIATRSNLRAFLDSSSLLLREEIAFQNQVHPDIVITDIDPLPVAAAAEREIPAIGISNFTWDWIMSELFPDIRDDIRIISEQYSKGTYLRLPMGPRINPFQTVVDVPLLRSGPDGDEDSARRILPDGKICLVALRNLPCGNEYLEIPEEYQAVSCSPEPLAQNIRNITPEKLASSELTFSDLMAASDVVVSKAGYGIVSQILVMGKPCVLFKGISFPEEPYLLDPLRNRHATVILNLSDLHLLQKALENVLKDPSSPPAVPCKGADAIISFLGGQA